MSDHSRRFVEEYDGLVGFGLDREANENTLTYYIQKFADDELMSLIRKKMSDEDLEALFNTLADLLRKYLSDEEYHRVFLKD